MEDESHPDVSSSTGHDASRLPDSAIRSGERALDRFLRTAERLDGPLLFVVLIALILLTLGIYCVYSKQTNGAFISILGIIFLSTVVILRPARRTDQQLVDAQNEAVRAIRPTSRRRART